MNGKKTLSPQEVVYLNMNRLMLGDGMNLYLHPSVSLKTDFYFPFEGKTFCEHDVPNGSKARATAQRMPRSETT